MTARPLVLALPTAVTLARLCAVPVAVWLILDARFQAALLVFVLAGLSDVLDGAIARLFNARTTIGSVLDPLADKALVVGVYVALGWVGLLPAWLVALVVARDLMLAAGTLVLRLRLGPVPVVPLGISKLNTALQIGVAGWVLAATGFRWPGVPGLSAVLNGVVATATVASGAAYVALWRRGAAPAR